MPDTSIADDLESQVLAALEEYGKLLFLESILVGTYNPATGASTVATPARKDIKGLFLGFRDALIDGTMIKMGDRRCILSSSGLTLAPKSQDVIIDPDNLRWQVISPLKTYEVQGKAFAYVLQVRRAG